jgi:hypothetical protein
MSQLPHIDPRAWREELRLTDGSEIRSHEFLRFLNRLCEALDVDIPRSDWPELTSLQGCMAYLQAHHASRMTAL